MNKALSQFSSFAGDRRGHVAMSFALTVMPLLTIIGGAVDLNTAYTVKQKLQALTDISAVSGARLPATSNENRMNALVSSFNVNAEASNIDGIVPKFFASNAEVQVEASAKSPTTILKLLGVDDIPVSAKTRARSQVQNGGVICLLALDGAAVEGLHLQGINKVSQKDCWAWVNSTSPTAINAVGASTGSAQGFCVAGGVIGDDHFSPAPYRGCDPYEDPFASKFPADAPYVGDCKERNLNLRNGYHTVTPGVYCGGISMKPQAIVHFEPGTYIIKDGGLDMQAQSVATGNGVTFYFTGNNTGIDVKGGAEMQLRAPATGKLASFLFVQDPASNPGGEVNIQGGGRVKMEGVLYTPTWTVAIGGNGEVNQEAQFWTMIAKSFHMEGNGRLFINSEAEEIGLPNIMPKIPTGPLLLN